MIVNPYFIPSIMPPIINPDLDNDGLLNEQEKQIGTDPANADTDHDGLSDGLEVNSYKTNPRLPDTDSDSLNDYTEIFTYGTNPLFPDSDDDGLNDGLEVNTYETNPLVSDTDGDNLTDGLEVGGWQIFVDGRQYSVTSNPLSDDSDGDFLDDWNEYAMYFTNPNNIDTDSDGLPDKWEVDYSFNPASSYDAFTDPDYDGLTNFQEYLLGTLIKDEVLSYQKDLFVEIDYMSGYTPSTTVIDYFVSYFRELNIHVHVSIDDQLSWSQLTAIGVSPDSLTPYECYLVERSFHDYSTTHVYVFYAEMLQDLDGDEPLGWASEFGAFLSKEKINSQEGLNVLWLTNRIKTERVVLLHEVGHTLNVIIRNQQGDEDYCSNFSCVMAGADKWWDIVGGVAQIIVLHSDSPRYCQNHSKLIDLRDKWSVDENWLSK